SRARVPSAIFEEISSACLRKSGAHFMKPQTISATTSAELMILKIWPVGVSVAPPPSCAKAGAAANSDASVKAEMERATLNMEATSYDSLGSKERCRPGCCVQSRPPAQA